MSDDVSTVEYRDIQGFTGYRIGDDGTVWSCKCRIPGKYGSGYTLGDTWKQLKGLVRSRGKKRYQSVRIKGDIKFSWHLIHRLVLLHFIGPCPEGMECRHLDGDDTNNRLSNLKWGTPLENAADKKLHGTVYRVSGELCGSAKLTQSTVNSIRDNRHLPVKELVATYNISRSQIGRILRNQSWIENTQPDVVTADAAPG